MEQNNDDCRGRHRDRPTHTDHTSLLHFDLDGRRQWPGPDARERLHPYGVYGQGREFVDGGQLIVVDDHRVPRGQLLVRVHRVVHLVPLRDTRGSTGGYKHTHTKSSFDFRDDTHDHLTVRGLGFFPLYDHRARAQQTHLNVPGGGSGL